MRSVPLRLLPLRLLPVVLVEVRWGQRVGQPLDESLSARSGAPEMLWGLGKLSQSGPPEMLGCLGKLS